MPGVKQHRDGDFILEVTVTIKSYDTKTGLDRQSEKQNY